MSDTEQAETKSDRFKRLRDKRLPNVLKGFELLTNLATGPSYEYTKEEAGGIVDSLDNALSDLSAAFGVARVAADVSPIDNISTEEEEFVAEVAEVASAMKADTKVADAPRTMAEGELELTKDETKELINTTGRQIDAAINAISDGDPELAMDLLCNLMRS